MPLTWVFVAVGAVAFHRRAQVAGPKRRNRRSRNRGVGANAAVHDAYPRSIPSTATAAAAAAAAGLGIATTSATTVGATTVVATAIMAPAAATAVATVIDVGPTFRSVSVPGIQSIDPKALASAHLPVLPFVALFGGNKKRECKLQRREQENLRKNKKER
jgi:hypothetical protein